MKSISIQSRIKLDQSKGYFYCAALLLILLLILVVIEDVYLLKVRAIQVGVAAASHKSLDSLDVN